MPGQGLPEGVADRWRTVEAGWAAAARSSEEMGAVDGSKTSSLMRKGVDFHGFSMGRSLLQWVSVSIFHVPMTLRLCRTNFGPLSTALGTCDVEVL